MSTVIKIDNLWKEYRLGIISHGTLTQDLQSWWARIRGKEDPNSILASHGEAAEKQIINGRFWALQDINIKVKEGEVLGLIGKNGAGKSTLLKILSRVTAPSRGQIKVKGRIASLLEVGTGFHQELTGMENIYMNGAILGMSKKDIDAQKDEIIYFSGVEKYIDTPVKRYSSGMRVRLAFAVAAHLDPEILVIDEVLAVGDVEFQKKCLGKMDQEAKSGKTILFVSHNMASVQSLCTKAILIENGTIRQEGEVDQIVSSYLNYEEESIRGIQLSERVDRKGNGLLRFQNVRFVRNNKQAEVTSMLSGDKIEIEITYLSRFDGDDVTFAIAFYTDHGNFLFSCSTNEINANANVNKGVGNVKCIIPKLQLSKGMYYYNIIAIHRNDILDVVTKAGFISVESGDYYKTGKNPAGDRAGFLVDYSYI